MKNTKKVLALVLAVVMLLGTMTIAAFAAAYTATGTDVTDGSTNIKYEVAQVATAEMSDGSSFDATDNNIYAVTVYAKTAEGIDAFILPLHFDKTHYDVVALVDSGIYMTSEDIGEDGVYSYTYGDAWKDTKMYKRDGSTVTNKALARYIGLGNANATAIEPTIKNYAYSGASASTVALWSKNLTSNMGVMMLSLNEQGKEKNAYFNAKDNAVVNDWMALLTVYFVRKDTVAETDCYGDIFGVVGDDKYGPDVTTDASGLPSFFNSEAAYVEGRNMINITNAAVEAAVKPLATLTAAGGAKSQAIAFNLAATATPTYTADDVESVDYRFVAQFSTTAFPITWDESTNKITATDIDEVGFVMAKVGDATATQIAAMSAADVAALSKDSGTIRKCWTAKISTDMAGGSAFAFSCRIKGIAVTGGTVASEYIAVPYVIQNSEISFGQAMTSSAQAKYDANIAKFLANKNA